MRGRLAGKIAILVGAARGIGAGIAERFVEEAAAVIMADTAIEDGEATAARLAEFGVAQFVAGDVSDKADAERLVEAALGSFGRVDILVQNAGIYPWTLIENIEPDAATGNVHWSPSRNPGRPSFRAERIAAVAAT